MSRRRYVPPTPQKPQPTAEQAAEAMFMPPSAQAKPAPAARSPLPDTVSIKNWSKPAEQVARDLGVIRYV